MIKERIKKIYLYRHILWDMTIKQLKAKYTGSMLGIWWAVITPLILAVSINFIFTGIFKMGVKNFTFFVLSGIVPWLFFSNALSEVTNSFIVNFSILKQGVFPREFIPISSILANFLSFLIGFLFLLPLFIILKLELIIVFPFLFLVLILHLLFLIGLGFLFSSLNVFFRDVSYFLSIGLMIWFWITPVFYSIDMVPLPYRWICLFNPITYYVISYQQILFEANALSLVTIFISSLISFVSLVIGYSFFIKKESTLLKKI